MRIVHVVRQFHPGVGGLESHVASLGREQVAAGHQVTVVTLDRIFDGDGTRLPARDTVRGIAVVRVPFIGSARYPIAPRVLGSIRDADVVHVHALDFFADFLANTALVHRKPMVLTTHGGFFHTGAGRLKRWYFRTITRRTLRAYRAVLACSASDAALFAPICGDRLLTVENGVDLERFGTTRAHGARTLIAFGRIAPNKEPVRLLHWFAALASRDPRWRLIVAGKPMGVDPAMLRQLIAQLGLADAVELHLSPNDAALRTLIARASHFLSASSYEGFGMAAVEAAAAGLYPVLSDIPPHAHIVERLGYGCTLALDDPGSTAAFLDRHAAGGMVVPDPAVRARVLQGFAWTDTARTIAGVYAGAIGLSDRTIGGISIRVLDEPAALDSLDSIVTRREPTIVAFCNAHTVNTSRDHADLRPALDRAVVLNDGIGVDLASRLLYGRRFPANLNGTDLVPAFLARYPRPLRLYLVGSAPGIAARAGQMLARRFPQVTVAGTSHGFVGPGDEAELQRRIRTSRPDLILVGMGQPAQERWAARNIGPLGVPILCVGGLLDFSAGATVRAPAWVRAAKLEWCHRLLAEPRRLAGRYLAGNLRFLLTVLRQVVRAAPPADMRRGHAHPVQG